MTLLLRIINKTQYIIKVIMIKGHSREKKKTVT